MHVFYVITHHAPAEKGVNWGVISCNKYSNDGINTVQSNALGTRGTLSSGVKVFVFPSPCDGRKAVRRASRAIRSPKPATVYRHQNTFHHSQLGLPSLVWVLVAASDSVAIARSTSPPTYSLPPPPLDSTHSLRREDPPLGGARGGKGGATPRGRSARGGECVGGRGGGGKRVGGWRRRSGDCNRVGRCDEYPHQARKSEL